MAGCRECGVPGYDGVLCPSCREDLVREIGVQRENSTPPADAKPINTLEGKMEPEADLPGCTSIECSLVSIAISLKRIADVAGDVVSYQFNEPAIRTRT